MKQNSDNIKSVKSKEPPKRISWREARLRSLQFVANLEASRKATAKKEAEQYFDLDDAE